LIPSKLYKQFEKDCLAEIPTELRNEIDFPVNVKATFYMGSKRRVDLVNLLEALDDMLQVAKVIKDDCRDIIVSHDGSRVYYDKEQPRIEVEITKVKDYEVWRAK
jgi:Holliday junction resolvase RusA-like endonuclease